MNDERKRKLNLYAAQYVQLNSIKCNEETMPGITHLGGLFGAMEATEWEFPEPLITWKIIYNPAYSHLPACITVFTRRLDLHRAVQVALDVHFPTNMGRGGANALGDSHGNLHEWIGVPAADADIYPHDHFIISPDMTHDFAIITAVNTLVGINHIGSPAYNVIEHLQSAT